MNGSACLLRDDVSDHEFPVALAALIAQLRDDRMTCEDVAADLAHAWEQPRRTAAALACLGREADRSGLANSFHNPAHTRDVAVIWGNLAVLHDRLAARGGFSSRLAAEHVTVGLYAAFGHDLLHDGVGNVVTHPPERPGETPRCERIPFKLERIAATHTIGILRACTVQADLLPPVAAAILVTDPVDGFATLEAAGWPQTPVDPAIACLDRPEWRLVAQMLRDADLMPSVGLTAAEHDRQSCLLGIEFGTDLNTAESAETLFRIATEQRFTSAAGVVFLPQFHVLRAINQLRGWGPGCLSLAAACRRVAGA